MHPMHYLLLIKNNLIKAKCPKHPSLSQHLTKKSTWKDEITPWLFLFFFPIIKVEKSFNNLKKTQRYKHHLLGVHFLTQRQVSNYFIKKNDSNPDNSLMTNWYLGNDSITPHNKSTQNPFEKTEPTLDCHNP